MQKSKKNINPQVLEHKQPLNQCRKELFSRASHPISTQILLLIGKLVSLLAPKRRWFLFPLVKAHTPEGKSKCWTQMAPHIFLLGKCEVVRITELSPPTYAAFFGQKPARVIQQQKFKSKIWPPSDAFPLIQDCILQLGQEGLQSTRFGGNLPV